MDQKTFESEIKKLFKEIGNNLFLNNKKESNMNTKLPRKDYELVFKKGFVQQYATRKLINNIDLLEIIYKSNLLKTFEEDELKIQLSPLIKNNKGFYIHIKFNEQKINYHNIINTGEGKDLSEQILNIGYHSKKVDEIITNLNFVLKQIKREQPKPNYEFIDLEDNLGMSFRNYKN